ncbi:TPA: hypothetical protein ACYLN4_000697 [Burkholderia lata]
MRLIIVRFDYNHSGGSASIRIGHEERLSSFEQPSYLGVECGFHIAPRPPEDLPDSNAVVPVPGSNEWLNLGILGRHPVNWPSSVDQPQMGAYKFQVARMIANMIANATLGDLDSQIPTVLVPNPSR